MISSLRNRRSIGRPETMLQAAAETTLRARSTIVGTQMSGPMRAASARNPITTVRAPMLTATITPVSLVTASHQPMRPRSPMRWGSSACRRGETVEGAPSEVMASTAEGHRADLDELVRPAFDRRALELDRDVGERAGEAQGDVATVGAVGVVEVVVAVAERPGSVRGSRRGPRPHHGRAAR